MNKEYNETVDMIVGGFCLFAVFVIGMLILAVFC